MLERKEDIKLNRKPDGKLYRDRKRKKGKKAR